METGHERTTLAVYPRWRGELKPHARYSINLNGLSPLARGTPENGIYGTLYIRFIPAGAGNSAALVSVLQL